MTFRERPVLTESDRDLLNLLRVLQAIEENNQHAMRANVIFRAQQRLMNLLGIDGLQLMAVTTEEDILSKTRAMQ
jgi:hypothetical protein